MTMADSIRAEDSLDIKTQEIKIGNLSDDSPDRKVLVEKLEALQDTLQNHNTLIRQRVDSLRAETSGVAVVLGADTLFYIYSKLGPLSPEERVQNIEEKINTLVEEEAFDSTKLSIVAGVESHDVMYDSTIIMSVTDLDAFWVSNSREELAIHFEKSLRKHVSTYYEETGWVYVLQRIGLMLLVLLLLFFGIRYMNKGFTRLNDWTMEKCRRYLKGLRFNTYQLLSERQQAKVVRSILKVLKWIMIALVVYLTLPVIFGIFPSTEGIAMTLINYVLDPLKRFVQAILDYIPVLFTILVILAITHYVVTFLAFLAKEVKEEKLHLPGFYPEWAIPTFSLLRVILYAFSFVIIFPYLPGSDSPAFRGVSVFFGLLISLGSSSAISNIIAGLVITYMRPFQLGDRVKIGDTTGDVQEKNLLVTRIRTIKNEDITIPNSAILNGSTTNYSANARTMGLILNTTITIGYDVPWRQVHELLISAALGTEYIKHDPSPFILQTSLDDYYVSYQLNAYTEEADKAAKIYSQLHANIQDAFNEAEVEILSPQYHAKRDGNRTTIPEQYLPPTYRPPSFSVKIEKDDNKDK
ncbi:mechanosensitive ion channel [Algivirga pacifica]|uniref:Mechanosensitive ion channel n=2 Tax=Algivirga pacifica TaxID=1162670 RepID=A0ABP9DFL7_9BACT